MCGFIGQVSYKDIDHNLLEASNRRIICRGPDEKKSFFGNSTETFSSEEKFNFSIFFNRLSILDLTENASQPMISNKFKTVLLFNGEIYNHKILRQELEKEGVQFISDHSDSEVVLNGFSYYGKSFAEKLIGQFSIVFFDFKLNKILLIRDRLGQKPLFFSNTKNNLVFGSNLESVSEISNEKEISEAEFYKYLNLGVVPSPMTIYKNIYKVRPGELIEFIIKKDNLKKLLNQYWNPADFVSEEEFKKDELYELINDSVNLRMKADVDIANFSSGGIDSTSIIKIASEKSSLNTFSMSVGDSIYDESKWFNAVANKYKSKHKTIIVDSDSISNEEIIESVKIFDEPYSDPSTLPSYLLSKEISKSHKVAISGDGGDELFGGYSRLSLSLNSNSTLLKHLYGIYPSYLGTGNRLLRHSKDINTAYSSFIEDKKLLDLLNIKIDYDFKHEYLNNTNNVIKNLLICDFKFYLSEMMMLKVDRTSMANSLEVRSPFVDHRLIEYMLSHEIKINLSNPKQELKNLLRNDFDHNFLNRKKMGFVYDIENWIFSNKSIITKAIDDCSFFENLNNKKIKLLFKFPSRINAIRIWKFYLFALFMEGK
tara:strand:+ start:3252 stop:5045 length:1794 start_codon:yes stop_codon:yes gene_type:complete